MNTEHEKQLAVLKTENKFIREQLEDLQDNQRQILAELNRYKGAVGMVLLIFSAIGTAIGIYFKLKVS